MECEDGLREIGCKFPFLGAMDGGGERIVEVQPLVSCTGLAQKCIILERFLRVGGKAVW